ncbi:unnamed protein product [Arabis nemorensis]|uniref:Uncharacterized protein n=1 Tax=Arabis nemorensis TaxID=586526 RepID=A0A565C5J5_9BRAS|nr:unnamed protein product [Arabis nemorensis]
MVILRRSAHRIGRNAARTVNPGTTTVNKAIPMNEPPILVTNSTNPQVSAIPVPSFEVSQQSSPAFDIDGI